MAQMCIGRWILCSCVCLMVQNVFNIVVFVPSTWWKWILNCFKRYHSCVGRSPEVTLVAKSFPEWSQDAFAEFLRVPQRVLEPSLHFSWKVQFDASVTVTTPPTTLSRGARSQAYTQRPDSLERGCWPPWQPVPLMGRFASFWSNGRDRFCCLWTTIAEMTNYASCGQVRRQQR